MEKIIILIITVALIFNAGLMIEDHDMSMQTMIIISAIGMFQYLNTCQKGDGE